jgi:hypothetical protein
MKIYDFSNPLNPKIIDGVMKAIEFGSTDGFAYNPGFSEFSIKRIAEYSGANTINLTWVEYVNKDTGQIDRAGRPDIEKNIEIVASIAQANGLNISLKPYFQIEGANFAPNQFNPVSFMDAFGLYDVLSDTSKKSQLNDFANKFLPNYKNYLINLGTTAQKINAVFLAIGGEMTPLDDASFDQSFWIPAINSARSVFSGQLTYVSWGQIAFDELASNYEKQTNNSAAAWSHSPWHHIGMYQYLDLVMPQIHEALTVSKSPTYEEAMNGWINNKVVGNSIPIDIIDRWYQYAQNFNKPLVTGESSFSSSLDPYMPAIYAAIGKEPTDGRTPLLVLQAILTQTFFDNLDLHPNKLDGYIIQYLIPFNNVTEINPDHSSGGQWWWNNYGPFLWNKPGQYTFEALSSKSYKMEGNENNNTFVSLVNHQTTINAAAGSDVIWITENQKTLGNLINGGEGVDKIIFINTLNNYTFTKINESEFSVQTKNAISDSLISIERLQFTDKSIAIDVNGNAGTTAKILGAVFGKESLSNKNYVGIGLHFLDAGWTYDNLAALALDAAGAKTNDQIVSLLWTNVIGTKPTAADKQPFIALLENGMSAGALAHLAADSSFNTLNINLVGLAQTGIEYLPVV